MCVCVCDQVAISRLHALADKDNGGAALWFLQCLLAHVVSAVDTFVTGEVRAVTGARPDIVEMYLSQDARFCSRQAKAPGEEHSHPCPLGQLLVSERAVERAASSIIGMNRCGRELGSCLSILGESVVEACVGDGDHPAAAR